VHIPAGFTVLKGQRSTHLFCFDPPLDKLLLSQYYCTTVGCCNGIQRATWTASGLHAHEIELWRSVSSYLLCFISH